MVLKSDRKMGFIKGTQREKWATVCSICEANKMQRLFNHQLIMDKTRIIWINQRQTIYFITAINQGLLIVFLTIVWASDYHRSLTSLQN